MKTKFNIHDEPIWELEAAGFIASHYKNEEDKITENYKKYGFPKEKMHDFLDKYITYKNAVLDEIIPIFNGKYIMLEPYFKPNDLGNPIIISIVQFNVNKLSNNMSDDDIDMVVVKILEDMAYDMISEKDKIKFNFKEIGDVINFLNKSKLDNDIKMQIINYHMDKYNLTRKLVDLLVDFAPICKKNFFIIEEEFKSSVNYLKSADDLGVKIRNSVGISFVSNLIAEVYINISFFNQFSMREIDRANITYIGMHLFKLCELRDKNKFNDVQIVSDMKALGDITRYKIICLLSKKRMYLQEMADTLESSPASISHHVNVLLQANIITIIVDSEKNKRIYYELNENKLNSLADEIKNLVKKYI